MTTATINVFTIQCLTFVLFSCCFIACIVTGIGEANKNKFTGFDALLIVIFGTLCIVNLLLLLGTIAFSK